jgi:hypothetical protein
LAEVTLRITILYLILALTPLVLMANGPTLLFEREGLGKVYVVNLEGQSVGIDCIAPQLAAIADQHKKSLLIPFKVKIFKDHTIVKEAWSKPSILIERTSPSGSERLLIPIGSNGGRIIIVGEKESYRLVAFDSSKGTLDLPGCLK